MFSKRSQGLVTVKSPHLLSCEQKMPDLIDEVRQQAYHHQLEPGKSKEN
jgi:hypothetical protein